MKILWFIIYPACSLFILGGAVLSFWTIRGIFKARAIAHWPTVEAKITECDFEADSDGEGGHTYEVIVKYRYNVQGREYESDKIHPAYAASSFAGHRKLHERLENATVVVAHYNESDPSESYLVTGSFSAHLASLFGGLLILSAGIFFLLGFHFAIAGNSDYVSGLEVIK